MINIGVPQFIGIIFTVTFSLMAVAWKTGARLGRVEALVEQVKDGFDKLKANIDNIRYKGFESHSPVQLTPKGEDLLNKSGLKEYIDAHESEFSKFCEDNFKMETSYDIQEAVFTYFDHLKFDLEMEKKLKEYVFNDGGTMEVARRIGAIYFRDICLRNMNRDLNDVDKE